jgi:Uma2 family endonuclease
MVVAARPIDESELPLQLPPLLLPMHWRLSPEQFEQVCQANPDAVLELSANGELIVTTATGSETSARNTKLLFLMELAIRVRVRFRSNCLIVPVVFDCLMVQSSALMRRWCGWSAGRF